jgi:sporulation protein YlmC with PRC-barrel domain
LRAEIMGTQVITRDTGRRLGVVGEVVVDIDRREVVALGLRDNPLTRFLPGLPRWMPLDRIRQVGDVILVDSVDSLAEVFNPERYSKVINCQVITESGQQLGRVLGFSFDIETGELTTLVIGALGIPLLGEGVLSTWELPVGEIVSSGTDRIIVYEGAEDKLKQLGTGLLEKLGIGGEGWEQEERSRLRAGMVPAENQLPAGQPEVQRQRRIQPASERAFQPEAELEYVELEERREREPLRQRRYLDEDSEPRGSERPYASDPYDVEPSTSRPFDEADRFRSEPSGRLAYGAQSSDRSPADPGTYGREPADRQRYEPADPYLPDRQGRRVRQTPSDRFGDDPYLEAERRPDAEGLPRRERHQEWERQRAPLPSEPRPDARIDPSFSDEPPRRRPLQAERPTTAPAGSGDPSRSPARERSAPQSEPIDVEIEPAEDIEDPW